MSESAEPVAAFLMREAEEGPGLLGWRSPGRETSLAGRSPGSDERLLLMHVDGTDEIRRQLVIEIRGRITL